MRFLRRKGAFCRTCGLAVFRQMQADTLLQGWWSPLSAFITPITLLMNLGALSTVRRIPQTQVPGWRPPLDPGKPVIKRPAGLIAAVPLAAVAVALVAVPVLLVIGLVVGDDRPEPLTIGSCARNDGSWSDQDLKTVSCGSSDAQFRVTEPPEAGCPTGDLLAGLEYSEDQATTLCLHPLER
ncbi:hypothetical protein ACFYO0_38600 [Streptomyces sp. NPDC006365]|uniref:LppU/SCO3897 family protein n=1 Tax=Streptomyces sp. NPDC006365 TaxID=3364744 RepID=UPI00367D398B